MALAVGLTLGLAVVGCGDDGDLEDLVAEAVGSAAGSSSSTTSSTTSSSTTSTTTTTVADEEVEVSVLDLRTGQCFEEPTSADEVETVLVVACSAPHTYEVFGVFELAGDGPYPGDESVLEQSDAGCLARFSPYVGAEYATSSLTYAFFYPLEREWTAVGDRGVACFAYRADGRPLTATIADSGL